MNNIKLEELALKYYPYNWQEDIDLNQLTRNAFIDGFMKRNEMCVYLVDLHNPYPDLSFEKYKRGFEILEECMKEMNDLNFSRYSPE